MDSSLTGKASLGNNLGGNGSENPSALKKQNTSDLDTILQPKLQVNDKNSETSDSPSDDDGNSGSTDMASKCLQKCATFPVSTISDGNPESQLEETSEVFTRSLSMPTVKKLISAMKGTRKKEGLPQKHLSVSWAPDVHDPPPSSVSHFPKKRNSRSQKKHGKGKQKGKSTRGGGGSAPKEKKHRRKSSERSGSGSDRCLDSYADPSKVQNYKSSLELLDFNDPGIGSTAVDRNCGSKFLGQASAPMHCVY